MVLSMDGLVLKEIGLGKERMTIGRRPSNDIQIDNLAISGEHAVVVTILSDSFLEDLNSTNGTLVNNQPIKKHLLRNGDVVELGKYKLKYIVEAASNGGSTFERSVAPRTDAANPLSESRQSAPAPQSLPPDPDAGLPGAIQVLNGANAGKELDLTKTLTTLGKPGRQVAVIARRPQGYFITHVEGSEFPSVNGQPIDAQAYPLKNHDVVDIAGIKMEFFLKK
jgi:pSer/pThr/pTyr-binding forkhead associated (FHA) protein